VIDRERTVERFLVDINPPAKRFRTNVEIFFIPLLVFGPIVNKPVSRIERQTFFS